MAYNNQYNYRTQSSYPNNRQQQNTYSPNLPAEIKAEELPTEYVDAAEKVIREIAENKKVISTSKIRNLLSMVSDIYNVENISAESRISNASKTALSMLRIRIAYEAGREKATKDFVEKAKLLQYVKGIGDDREKLINFSHYMESLVAYHRYYLGEKG